MLFPQTISHLSFKQWLWQDHENRRLLWFSFLIMIISFGWLKYLYPYPNFMPPDSYSYLEAATKNDFINMWPIGYSKFLRLVSVFTRSHLILVILQYLILMLSVLYFLITIRYLLSPGKWLFRIIVLISITNPLLPHIANFVSSDCLFAALSLTWFSQLLWIIYKASPRLLIIHAVIVLLAFTVRFSALYYPLVSILLILFSTTPKRTKWIGIFSVAILTLGFIGSTQYEYKTRTNTIQYSAFGGWQLAANALYGYAWAIVDKEEMVPFSFKELHTIVKQHMDSISQLKYRPDKEPGIYYLWDFKSPLRLYLDKQIAKNKQTDFLKNWASVAPLYNQYGLWLIKKYPGSFLLHYAWPNLIRYYNPPPYFMGAYNLGKTAVDSVASNWFNWKNNLVPTRTKSWKIQIMDLYPTLLAILNPALIINIIFFFTIGGFNNNSRTSKNIIYCMLLVWLSNTIFSVLSAPIELRYQIFPVVITWPFCVFLISRTIQNFNSVNKTIHKKTFHYETI